MDKIDNRPSHERIQKLLDIICPGSRPENISAVDGSYSNYTHLLEVSRSDGRAIKLIIRQYAVFGNYDRGEKARREYATLHYVNQYGIPSPRPVYLVEDGGVLGNPGIVTEYVDGKLDMIPAAPERWAREMAATLAHIHALPAGIPDGSFILDANREATWFLRNSAPPEFMAAYPGGKEVWKAADALFLTYQPPKKSLVHIDYWPGNILWKENRISAVVDWEEAAYGDPDIDVAYAMMEISISGYSTAAEDFLESYRQVSGRKAMNLLLWKMAAAARPMFSPETWDIVEGPRRERFNNFVENILRDYANKYGRL